MFSIFLDYQIRRIPDLVHPPFLLTGYPMESQTGYIQIQIQNLEEGLPFGEWCCYFEVNNCVFVAPGAAKVSMVVASWLGEVIRWPTGAQILNLTVWRGSILDNFLSNSNMYEAKGVQMEAPKYGIRKVSKKM